MIQGHAACYIDAEHATPQEFFAELFGVPLDEVPNFFAERPANYEETIEKVDAFLAWVRGIREGDAAEKIPGRPDLCSIIVVDSINKLVPRRELSKILSASGEIKGGKKGETGADELAKGHHARTRAALNQAWLDHLVPRLSAANCALVLIAQERNEDEEGFTMEEIVKVKGGAALLFDASMIIRIMKSSMISEGEGKDRVVYGFKHRIRIWKSKVSHMDGRWTDCAFNLSNGALTKAGFDTARDAVELGKALGIIEGSTWLAWNKKKWNGEKRAILSLSEDPDLLNVLLGQIALKTRPKGAA